MWCHHFQSRTRVLQCHNLKTTVYIITAVKISIPSVRHTFHTYASKMTSWKNYVARVWRGKYQVWRVMWVCGHSEWEDIIITGIKQCFLPFWLVTWSVAWPCSHVNWADEMLCRTKETPLPWKDVGSRSISTWIPSRLHRATSQKTVILIFTTSYNL